MLWLKQIQDLIEFRLTTHDQDGKRWWVVTAIYMGNPVATCKAHTYTDAVQGALLELDHMYNVDATIWGNN